MFSVLNIFNGAGSVPIEILHSEDTTSGQQTIDISNGTPSIPIDFTQIMTPLFPAFNVLIWLAVAFFLVSAGARIASIGIKLMNTSPSIEGTIKTKEKKDKHVQVKKEKTEGENEKLKEPSQ